VSFSSAVLEAIAAIPSGRVATYGQIAAMAGNPRGARGVVWILRSSSRKHKLPWHRVIAAGGRIALGEGRGREEQIALLDAEGVPFRLGKVDMEHAAWKGSPPPGITGGERFCSR
jgi:methylated-DNA-protein-cysteine methyltransferase related protein